MPETLQRVRVWWERMVFARMVAPEWIARNGSRAVRPRPLQRFKSRGNPEFRWYRGNLFALSFGSGRFLLEG